MNKRKVLSKALAECVQTYFLLDMVSPSYSPPPSENCSLATLDWSRDGDLTVGEPIRALPWKMKGKDRGERGKGDRERERETKKKRSIR